MLLLGTIWFCTLLLHRFAMSRADLADIPASAHRRILLLYRWTPGLLAVSLAVAVCSLLMSHE